MQIFTVSSITILTIVLLMLFSFEIISNVLFVVLFIPLGILMFIVGYKELRKVLND